MCLVRISDDKITILIRATREFPQLNCFQPPTLVVKFMHIELLHFLLIQLVSICVTYIWNYERGLCADIFIFTSNSVCQQIL